MAAIYRHDFVARTVLDGIMRVQLDTGVPFLSAVLTPRNFQETEAHIRFFKDHFVIKVREADQACRAMVAARADLLASRPRPDFQRGIHRRDLAHPAFR
jgi:6,7-dimethyl-8-ribityllumazine synthase